MSAVEAVEVDEFTDPATSTVCAYAGTLGYYGRTVAVRAANPCSVEEETQDPTLGHCCLRHASIIRSLRGEPK